MCVWGGGVVFLETLFSFDNDDGDILNNVDNRFSPTSTKTVPKLSIAGHTKFFISTVVKKKHNVNSDNETIDRSTVGLGTVTVSRNPCTKV